MIKIITENFDLNIPFIDATLTLIAELHKYF